MRRFLHHNVLYLAGGLAAGLLGYVYHFLAGRLLGRVSYGQLASLLAATYLLALPATVITTVAMRFAAVHAARRDRPALRGLLEYLSLRMAALALSLLIAFGLGRHFVAQFFGLADVRLAWILAVAAAVWVVLPVNRGMLQGMQRFGFLSANLVLDMVVRIGVAVGLVLAGLGVAGAFLAAVVGPLAAYGHSFIGLRGVLGTSGARQTPDPILGRFAIRATIGLLGITFLFNVDLVLAKHFLPDEAAGTYAAAAILARVVYFGTYTFAGVMFPEVTALRSRDLSHFHIFELSLASVALIGSAVVLGYWLLPQVALLPFGGAFGTAGPYLAPLAAALTCVALANLAINYFLSVDDARFAVPLLLACALEPVLIVFFHRSVGQIVTAVLISNVLLVVALGILYGLHRTRGPRVTSG